MKKLKNLNLPKAEQHPFHLVNSSPWPLLLSISLLAIALSFVDYFHYSICSHSLPFSLICGGFIMLRWFTDIITESTYEGHHTMKVQKGIRIGMCLFIASEVMFFFSFFWAFFHLSLSPAVALGCI
jgi:cytochrome c oxidase subunit 3